MPDDGKKEKSIQQNRFLSCGIELSDIKKKHFDIKTGEPSDLVLPNINFVPGAGEGKEMVSGEALFFPKDKGVSFIMGRHGDTDIQIDTEIIKRSDLKTEHSATKDHEEDLIEIDEAMEAAGLPEQKYIMTVSDPYISRHQLQVSRHPNGVTVVTAGPSLGRGSYTKENKPGVSRDVSKVSVLRNFSKESVVHPIQPTIFQDSYALRNGDVVMVKGGNRRYCFRFFEAVGKGGLEFKPAMMIKQSYPLSKPISEIHKEVIIDSVKK